MGPPSSRWSRLHGSRTRSCHRASTRLVAIVPRDPVCSRRDTGTTESGLQAAARGRHRGLVARHGRSRLDDRRRACRPGEPRLRVCKPAGGENALVKPTLHRPAAPTSFCHRIVIAVPVASLSCSLYGHFVREIVAPSTAKPGPDPDETRTRPQRDPTRAGQDQDDRRDPQTNEAKIPSSDARPSDSPRRLSRTTLEDERSQASSHPNDSRKDRTNRTSERLGTKSVDPTRRFIDKISVANPGAVV